MALTSNINRKAFTALAAQTAFAFGDVLYFDQTHLQVYVDGVLKTLTTHYTVLPTTNTPNGVAGGAVTFVSPMVGDEQVIVLRVVPLVQSIDYQEFGKFPANTHEKGLDWLTMIAQQHDEQFARSLVLPSSETGTPAATNLPNRASRIGRFLGWDTNGDIIAATPLSVNAVVSTFMETVLDDVTAPLARSTLGSSTVGDALFVTASEAAARDTLLLGDMALQTLAVVGFTTGDVKPTFKTVADSGWILADDGTIGNAVSGATTRANADTANLYTLFWTNCANAQCAVSTGRGGSAAADFAANKTLAIPKMRSRVLGLYGAGSGLTSRVLGVTLGAETHANTTGEMATHDHRLQATAGATDTAISSATGIAGWNNGAAGFTAGITDLVENTGSGTAWNIMNPVTFLNLMVKL